MRQWLVKDVMTTEVVTAPPQATIGELASLLATHRIGGLPVVGDDGRVAGLVSAADLLREVTGGWRPHRLRRRPAPTGPARAEDLMRRPAPAVGPDTALAAAAREMDRRQIGSLVVIDGRGHPLGVISRSDLIGMLARPDQEIQDDIADRVLRRTLWLDPSQIQPRVHDGVVSLTGQVGRRSTAAIAARLSAAVPGVVGVVDGVRYVFDDTDLVRSRINRTHPFSAAPFDP